MSPVWHLKQLFSTRASSWEENYKLTDTHTHMHTIINVIILLSGGMVIHTNGLCVPCSHILIQFYTFLDLVSDVSHLHLNW